MVRRVFDQTLRFHPPGKRVNREVTVGDEGATVVETFDDGTVLSSTSLPDGSVALDTNREDFAVEQIDGVTHVSVKK
jgi:hypothetical protein